jgi:hypothetical protein
MYCATQDATVPSLHKKIIVIIKQISYVYIVLYLFNIILVSSYYSYNILSSTNNFGILPTLVVYLKIYEISFVNLRTTKITRGLTKLFCVGTYPRFNRYLYFRRNIYIYVYLKN